MSTTVHARLLELPAKIDPLGIKGIRGAETIAAPPAVVNAVIDAPEEFAVPISTGHQHQSAYGAAMNSREEHA